MGKRVMEVERRWRGGKFGALAHLVVLGVLEELSDVLTSEDTGLSSQYRQAERIGDPGERFGIWNMG
jgi:hypothetical protein